MYMDAHCTSPAFQLNPCNVSLGTDALHGFWHHDIPVQMADDSEGLPGRWCSQKWLQAQNKETISKLFGMFSLLRLKHIQEASFVLQDRQEFADGVHKSTKSVD